MTLRGTRSAPEVLSRAQLLVQPALRRAVERLSPWIRKPIAYHMGWEDQAGNPASGGGGKGVRSALCLLGAEGVGADAETGVPAGVAVELVHNFSLLHDDIIDGDRERRHRATVWSLWGVGQAIIAGDALLSLAHEVLMEAPSLAAPEAARRLAAATSAMIAGQAQDMAQEGCLGASLEATQAMERGKTGALLGAAASLGAVLAEADDGQVSCLENFGVELGLAFQATDDVLGIWGDPQMTGKPAWSDLRQAKATLPVAAALAEGGPLAQELAEILAKTPLPEELLARAASLVEQLGGREYAEQAARQHLRRALGHLEEAKLSEEAHEQARELAQFVVERVF
jgi:geranylgeranyl diphosphate synthase type I